MRRSMPVLALTLFAMLCALPGFAQWQKQGVASGAINDIMRMPGSSSTETLWWLGTQGGIFAGRYMTSETWQEAGDGLYSPSVLKVDGYKINFVSQMKAILTDDGVYARQDGTDWVWADTTGLQEPLGGPFGYDTATDVAVAAGTGKAIVYAGFGGHGVWRREFCATGWCEEPPVFSDDAEINRDYWITATPWELSLCDKHNGVRSWKAGAVDDCGGVYAPNLNAGLTLKGTIDLGSSVGHGTMLRFWDRMATESGWDYCYVEIADDETSGFQNWQVLDQRSGYTDWTERIVSLDAYTGPVKIRFRFTSDGSSEYEGWFVDDITVSRPVAWAQVQDSTGAPIGNPQVTALYIHDTGSAQTLYAATKNDFDGGYFGNIYALPLAGGVWGTKGVVETDYLSLDGPAPGDASRPNPLILAGTDGAGVHAGAPGGSFGPLCGESRPGERFIDVSVDRGDATERTFAAITDAAAYRLDPNCVASAYLPYPRFNLRGASILSDCSNTGFAPNRLLVGTLGTGLVELSCTQRGLPPVFLGNEGQTGVSSALAMKNVAQLALSPTDPPVIFAASGSDGMFKARYPVDGRDYFVRYFYDPLNGGSLPATAIALHPNYDDNGEVLLHQQTIFLATRFRGIYRSKDGGASWERLWASPQGKIFADLKIGPASSPVLAALTLDAEVWLSYDEGDTWFAADMAHLGTAANRGHALAVSPNFDFDGVIFVATEEGLFKLTSNFWEPVFTGRPVLSVAVAPQFKEDPLGGNRETMSVIIGTRWGGLYASSSYGNFDFSPLALPSAYAFLQFGDIPTIAMHPQADIDPTLDLYNCFTYRHRDLGMLDGVYCMRFNIGDEQWKPVRVSAGSADLGDLRITDLKFHPFFQRTNAATALLYASHQNKKVFRGLYQTADQTYQWASSAGFFHTPPFVYAVAESPDLTGTVLAGTKGYGPMMSFDGGSSYYPWPAVQKDGYVLHDVYAAAITHGTEACQLLLSAGDPAYPTAIKDYGVFYQEYMSPLGPGAWTRASLCLANCTDPGNYSPWNFDGHRVLELRYLNPDTDILASDLAAGPLKSDPADANVPGGLGMNWQLETGGDLPLTLADISSPGSGSYRSLDPRGRTGFVWGAQGTLSAGRDSTNAPGAYRYNPNLTTAAWESASGTTTCSLPSSKDWRAILMTSNSSVLLGARDGTGIYRSGNADASSNASVCWTESNMGLNANDRDFDSTQYSKRVTAFVKVSNGILASMEATPAGFVRSGTGEQPGGIFFSDTNSGGRAWVPVSTDITCASSYELAGGSKMYSGTTCDGIYATTTIAYTGQPTAYFIAQNAADPWNESRVNFTDYSAGFPTNRIWDFGDGSVFGSGTFPSHDYEAGVGFNTFTAILTSIGQTASSDSFSSAVEVVNALITGVTKSGEKLHLAWQEVTAAGKTFSYTIRRAASPSGAGNTEVPDCVPSCSAGSCACDIAETGLMAYYKLLTTWWPVGL